MVDDFENRVRRTLEQPDESVPQLLSEILTVLRHIDSNERSGAISSAKITLQRGTVDITVHSYTGSDIHEAEQEALASYRRLLAGLNQDGVDAFGKTLEMIKR